jgi:hypothetical protein
LSLWGKSKHAHPLLVLVHLRCGECVLGVFAMNEREDTCQKSIAFFVMANDLLAFQVYVYIQVGN